ncbi:substrate-binding domain-containing protein [Calidifontibacter sp. DB0510]|uniref:Substrate-binding domain-containing protein n=1 Tax=Metallococcus carri TaxID=1656884 RepID=A0A967B1W1_9MICO|nr:substrate-binding domain-containing protein [Metallococcus carri]NHN57291.1 substrate-binding domain-containing protein [Metallococcus carri]NOP38104.1 substrate-binding domain-containing protein [Calidifontibacter sp. DB2511S]
MDRPFTIALAIPLQGPGGIFGPSCELVARLASEQLNAAAGLLGREVRLHVVDAGAPPRQVATELQFMARSGFIDAVTGWHISSVREVVAPALPDAIPYLYTSLHEGGRPGGAILVGEHPSSQVIPALAWLRREIGLTRWAVIGSDYVWPRGTAATVSASAGAAEIEIVREEFVPYGCADFRPAIERIRRTTAQAVLMLLVGRDAVLFNRQFAAAGLADRLSRFTPLMEENMLLASGAESTRNLFVAAAYFSSLTTTSALDLVGEYAGRFGPSAPVLNNEAESCYEGILALAAAVRAAGSGDGTAIRAAALTGFSYEGPRGTVRVGSAGSDQDIYIARASGYEFEVMDALTAPAR